MTTSSGSNAKRASPTTPYERSKSSADETILAPVPKLDAATLVQQIREHTGTDLELLGAAPAGQVGAGYVRWRDGHEGVLTWWGDTDAAGTAQVQRTADLLEHAKACGLPVPRYELVAEVPAGVAIVQQRLPGHSPTRVDRTLVEAMVEINERFAGLLAHRPDVAAPPMYLDRSAEGFCVHESLEVYDERTRRLLAWIRDVGRSEPTNMTGDDLVHLDFHPGNVLVVDRNEITGIVDWDGIGRGDRRFGLVTLRFDLAALERQTEPAVAGWFDGLLDDVIDPSTLRLYWAHMSLRMVDWAIRHFTADDVTHWLDVAAARID